MNLQVLMFKPEQPKIQMYMSYINPCSLYLCYTKLIFFFTMIFNKLLQNNFAVNVVSGNHHCTADRSGLHEGKLYSTLKGISIYFITE